MRNEKYVAVLHEGSHNAKILKVNLKMEIFCTEISKLF